MNDLLKNSVDVLKVFCKFCELVTKLTVVLIKVRKANFDVDEKGIPLKFGRYRQIIIPLNALRSFFVSFLKPSSQFICFKSLQK